MLFQCDNNSYYYEVDKSVVLKQNRWDLSYGNLKLQLLHTAVFRIMKYEFQKKSLVNMLK